MRRQILMSLLVGAAVLAAGELRAQQPAPPNLDAVPEKMPIEYLTEHRLARNAPNR